VTHVFANQSSCGKGERRTLCLTIHGRHPHVIVVVARDGFSSALLAPGNAQLRDVRPDDKGQRDGQNDGSAHH
jgi:hypothetical protein